MKKIYSFIVVVLMLAASSFLLYAGSDSHRKRLTVDVVPNLDTFSFVDINSDQTSSPGEPFIITGDIFKKGTTKRLGDFIMPNEVEAYRAGDKPFEFKGTNGFMITVDINSKDVM